MGRPRKNKVGDYAAKLVEEISFHMSQDLARSIQASQDAYRDELNTLRGEVLALRKEVELLTRKSGKGKPKDKLGRWVPGGPGRPPKDAAERVAAFAERANLPIAAPKKPPSRSRK